MTHHHLIALSRVFYGALFSGLDPKMTTAAVQTGRPFTGLSPDVGLGIPVHAFDFQIDRTLKLLECTEHNSGSPQSLWCERTTHYRQLLCKVIHQTQQRVYENISVPACEKILSVFEPHTDIIVKVHEMFSTDTS